MNNAAHPLVWIVHPRSIQDVEREMSQLKLLPSFLKKLVLMCIPPYKVSEFSEDGHVRGYVVAVPLLPEHFQKYRSFAGFRLIQAFKLAKSLGADKVSIGGMITTLVGKMGLSDRFGLDVFDGTGLLAQIAVEKIIQLISVEGIKTVGIIGATTKVGSSLSKYLMRENIKELHLFAKTAANVENLSKECKLIGNVEVFCHTNLVSTRDCDVCILTSFIPDVGNELVSNLKPGSFFFSIIEPVSPFVADIEKLRPDVHLTRGVNIVMPSLSYSGLDTIVQSGSTFSCLAEALMDGTKDVNSRIEFKGTPNDRIFQVAFSR